MAGAGLAAFVVAMGCAGPPSSEECEDVFSPDAWVEGGAPTFVELWRAGGANEGEELAVPMSINVGPDGQLAVVDFELGVAGVGPDGTWLGALTRAGDGPGEVEMPLAAAYADDSTLAILDFGNGKIVFLDSGGELIRESRVDPLPLGRVLRKGQLIGLGLTADGTGLITDREPRPESGEILQVLVRLPRDGSSADTIVAATVPTVGGGWEPARNEIAPGWPRLVSSAAADGRIAYAGHTSGYAIEILEPDGGRREICRTVDPTPLRPDEFEVEISEDSPAEYRDALANAVRPEQPAPISRLLFGRQGRLWVERERFGRRDGPAAFLGRPGSLFDVFDRDDRYLGEVRTPEGAHLMAASGDLLWMIEYGPFDVPTVVAYRMETGQQ